MLLMVAFTSTLVSDISRNSWPQPFCSRFSGKSQRWFGGAPSRKSSLKHQAHSGPRRRHSPQEAILEDQHTLSPGLGARAHAVNTIKKQRSRGWKFRSQEFILSYPHQAEEGRRPESRTRLQLLRRRRSTSAGRVQWPRVKAHGPVTSSNPTEAFTSPVKSA